MEIGGNTFTARGQNGNTGSSTNLGWDIWEFNTSRFDWNNSGNLCATNVAANATTGEASGSMQTDASPSHALMFPSSLHHHHNHLQQHSLYGGDGSFLNQDPHLTCLKLGKRHYFEDASSLVEHPAGGFSGFSVGKKGKPYYSLSDVGGTGARGGGGGPSSSAPVVGSTTTVPRCQVEGCHVALVNAKDYHRRHKVCEMHSKAPRVVVLGLEQRFCQQCSRFHVVSEFDDSKRSCRRRLAGHNERRRKSSHDSVARNSSQDNKLMTGRFPYLSSPTGRALSLLSSKADSWVSPSDLSFRSSAALRELIAENRAAILARQLIQNREWHTRHQATIDPGESHGGSNSCSNSLATQEHQLLPEPQSWERFHESSGHITLDLMQAPSSAFGLLSMRGKTKEEEEECSELWNYGSTLWRESI